MFLSRVYLLTCSISIIHLTFSKEVLMKTDRTLTDTRPSVQKARRLLLSILFENELTDGHFEIFQILYNKLNLFDNKRLCKQLGTYSCDIKNIQYYIYADMIGIFLEEIIDNDNIAVRQTLEEYYENKYENKVNQYISLILEVWKEKKTDVAHAQKMQKLNETEPIAFNYSAYYVHTYYGEEASDLFINSFFDNYKESKRLDRNVVNQNEFINRYFKIDDIRKTNEYLKLKAGFKKRINEFLTINSKDFEGNFLYLTAFCNEKNKYEILEKQFNFYYFVHYEETIFSVLDKSGISWTSLIDKDIFDYKKTVDRAVDNVCLCRIEYAIKMCVGTPYSLPLKEMTANNILDEPEGLLVQLISSFYLELLCDMIKKLLKTQYTTFSFRNVTGKSDAEFVQRDLDKLQEAYNRLSTNYRKLEDSLKAIERADAKDNAKLIRPYQEKITALERKNEKLQQENEELKAYQKSQAEYIELLQKLYSENPLEQNVSVDMEELSTITPLFIGGVPDVVKAIRSNFRNSKHIQDTKSGKIDTTGISCIVMFFEFMNHALFYKVINTARAKSIPVVYVRGTNTNQILNTIWIETVSKIPK